MAKKRWIVKKKANNVSVLVDVEIFRYEEDETNPPDLSQWQGNPEFIIEAPVDVEAEIDQLNADADAFEAAERQKQRETQSARAELRNERDNPSPRNLMELDRVVNKILKVLGL